MVVPKHNGTGQGTPPEILSRSVSSLIWHSSSNHIFPILTWKIVSVFCLGRRRRSLRMGVCASMPKVHEGPRMGLPRKNPRRRRIFRRRVSSSNIHLARSFPHTELSHASSALQVSNPPSGGCSVLCLISWSIFALFGFLSYIFYFGNQTDVIFLVCIFPGPNFILFLIWQMSVGLILLQRWILMRNSIVSMIVRSFFKWNLLTNNIIYVYFDVDIWQMGLKSPPDLVIHHQRLWTLLTSNASWECALTVRTIVEAILFWKLPYQTIPHRNQMALELG